MKMKTAWIEEMNWMEAQQAIKDAGGIAIVPIGCLEQWGAFPSGCDTYQCMGHVNRVVELAQEDPEIKQIVVLPMVAYGYQPMMKDFPGTVNIRFEVMREFFRDIAESLIRHGVMKFIWCSGHGASCHPLIDMAYEFRDKYGKPLAWECKEFHIGSDAYYFVRVPRVRATDTDYIYMYIGGKTSKEDAGGVWADSCLGIYHMDDDPDTSHIADSTRNGNDGTKRGANEPQEQGYLGLFGDFQRFDGSDDYIQCGDFFDIVAVTGPDFESKSSHFFLEVILPAFDSQYVFQIIHGLQGVVVDDDG